MCPCRLTMGWVLSRKSLMALEPIGLVVVQGVETGIIWRAVEHADGLGGVVKGNP